MGKIGLGEALLLKVAAVDASGKGHGLKAEAADAIDVVNGEAHHVSQLMIVQALDDGGNQNNLQSHFAAVLDGGHLGFHQALGARAQVNVIIHAVELKVEGVQTRFFRGLRELEIRKLDSVGGCLQVSETEFRGLA